MSRIVLIGCGKAKAKEPCRAADLYTGSLFRDRRRYAEAAKHTLWWIISARYGLLPPDTLTRPYDAHIKDLAEIDRAAWSLSVAQDLLSETWDGATLKDISVEIHAGKDYAEQLRDVLRSVGLAATWPVEHMGIGEQRAWYGRQSRLADAVSP